MSETMAGKDGANASAGADKDGANVSAGRRSRRRFSVPPVFIVLALLVGAIAVLANFPPPPFYMNILKQAAPLAILAAGQLYVIVSGGFDLSAGSVITMTVIGSSILINGDPAATWWVISLMLAMGVVVGIVNGAVVCFLKVPSIIATLGMMITINGIALAWSGGAPRGYLPDTFRFFGRYLIRDVPYLRIIPVALFVLIILGFALWWIMHRTHYGKMLHAVGDNPRAAQLSGVPINRVRIMAFVVSALSAVVAGILLGGFAGVSTDVGTGYELQAITAAVIGGAMLLGGRGSVSATIGGALTLQAIFTLLNILGLPKPTRDVVQGLILISAVALVMIRRGRSGT